MNLFRSTAAVIATLGVALAAGNLFHPATAPDSATGDQSDHLSARDSASLAVTFSDAPEPGSGLSLPSAEDDRPDRKAEEKSGAEPEAPAQTARSTTGRSPLPKLRLLMRTAGELPDLVALPAADDRGTGNASASASASATPEPDPLAAIEECQIWLVVTPESQAMLDLSLYAPCDGGARVEISHEGLRFSQRLGDDGQLMLALPALAESASVTATLPDGRSAEDRAEIADIALTDRLLLVWQGADALALNAHVGGAAHGEDGHVHPAQPGSAADGAQHGFVTLLGDPALDDAALAQIYTFPARMGADSGHVELAVEAAITAESCGQRISAESRLVRAGQPATPRRLSLTIPACDGFEGFLAIDGLIPELTLAQN